MIRVLETSTRPIECELDDGAHAFVKVLGNPEGRSALACELIGTGAARLLGLPVLDVAIPEFPHELCVPLEYGLVPQPGPCFATQFVEGSSWDGRGALLDALEHPEHIPGLVVLDTWLRNPDRYLVRAGRTRKNLRNVFLREGGVPRGLFRLLAIDHTHVIRQDGELTSLRLRIDRERDDTVYGLFPRVREPDRPRGPGTLRGAAATPRPDQRNRRPGTPDPKAVASRWPSTARSRRLPQGPCDARRDPRRKLVSDRVQMGSISPERPMNHPGFYSVVRFCPDIERGEAVNVGVIVGAPGLGMRVRMAERNEYVKRRLGAEAFDNTRLTLTKEGFAERLKDVEPRAEAVAAFGAAEAGKLQISAPRPMVLKELDDDVIALFLRLVEDPELQRRERRTPKPDLSPIVRQLQRRNVPIQRRPEVSVPVLDAPFTADFAFQNGARNLVKAVGLSRYEENALEEASDLGSKGLLFVKHPGPDGAKSKLIVVAEIDDQQLRQRVDRLLSDHEVRLVEANELPSFAAEIEREAH